MCLVVTCWERADPLALGYYDLISKFQIGHKSLLRQGLSEPEFFFCGSLNVISVLFLYFRARLFVDALWSPAGKGLTSWLSFVVSNCEFGTFPLVSWVRCGT